MTGQPDGVREVAQDPGHLHDREWAQGHRDPKAQPPKASTRVEPKSIHALAAEVLPMHPYMCVRFGVLSPCARDSVSLDVDPGWLRPRTRGQGMQVHVRVHTTRDGGTRHDARWPGGMTRKGLREAVAVEVDHCGEFLGCSTRT